MAKNCRQALCAAAARWGQELRHALAPACVVCGITRAALRQDPLCAGCRADYFDPAVCRCPVCANPLAAPRGAPGAPSPCGRCLAQPPHFDGTRVLGHHALPLDAMVGALKFHARLDIGRALGVLPAQRAAGLAADAIVPLPLARERLRERGFNQAEEIARALGRELGLPVLPRVLMRRRRTPAQHSLPLSQRRTNVRGAFAACARLDAMRLLLVDDVLTTGATLDKAGACCKAAGALWICNLVVARTP